MLSLPIPDTADKSCGTARVRENMIYSVLHREKRQMENIWIFWMAVPARNKRRRIFFRIGSFTMSYARHVIVSDEIFRKIDSKTHMCSM